MLQPLCTDETKASLELSECREVLQFVGKVCQFFVPLSLLLQKLNFAFDTTGERLVERLYAKSVLYCRKYCGCNLLINVKQIFACSIIDV